MMKHPLVTRRSAAICLGAWVALVAASARAQTQPATSPVGDAAADRVDLRGGQQYQGTVRDASFKLVTPYGTFDVPLADVASIGSTGEGRGRQLLATRDGQVLGGRVEKPTLAVALTSGRTVEVPWSGVTRLARAAAVAPVVVDRPTVQLACGDVLAIKLPQQDVEVITRYGPMKLRAGQIASIQFDAKTQPLHLVTLADGSTFGGVVTTAGLAIELAAAPGNGGGGGGGGAVNFPTGSLAKLTFVPKPDATPDRAARLQLVNDEVLVGTLRGELRVETSLETVRVEAAEVRQMSFPKDQQDAQVTLADGFKVRGQIAEADVECVMRAGPAVRVPVGLIREYDVAPGAAAAAKPPATAPAVTTLPVPAAALPATRPLTLP